MNKEHTLCVCCCARVHFIEFAILIKYYSMYRVHISLMITNKPKYLWICDFVFGLCHFYSIQLLGKTAWIPTRIFFLRWNMFISFFYQTLIFFTFEILFYFTMHSRTIWIFSNFFLNLIWNIMPKVLNLIHVPSDHDFHISFDRFG